MAEKKYLNKDGLLYLWGKIKAYISESNINKVDKVAGKGLSTEDYSTLEKNKLAGLNNYTHPTATAMTEALYKVEVSEEGHITGATRVVKADITGLGIPAQDTKYGLANATADGLMPKANFTKLNGIEAGAQVNDIETVAVNGVNQTITSKKVNITVPTNVNQLANGSGFQTDTQVKASIAEALKSITGIDFKKVAVLPATGVKGTIYLIEDTENPGSYLEWFWTGAEFEMMGSTMPDLTQYVMNKDILLITNAEIDTITSV